MGEDRAGGVRTRRKRGRVIVERNVTALNTGGRIGTLGVNRNVDRVADVDFAQSGDLVNFGRRRNFVRNRNRRHNRNARRGVVFDGERNRGEFDVLIVGGRIVFADQVPGVFLDALGVPSHPVGEFILTGRRHGERVGSDQRPLRVAVSVGHADRIAAERGKVLVGRVIVTGVDRVLGEDRAGGVRTRRKRGRVIVERNVTALNTGGRIGTLGVNRNVNRIAGLGLGDDVHSVADACRRIVDLCDNGNRIGHDDHRRDRGRIIAGRPGSGVEKRTLLEILKLETAMFQALFGGHAETALSIAEKIKNRHTQTPSDVGFLRNAKLTKIYKNTNSHVLCHNTAP